MYLLSREDLNQVLAPCPIMVASSDKYSVCLLKFKILRQNRMKVDCEPVPCSNCWVCIIYPKMYKMQNVIKMVKKIHFSISI